MTRRKPTCGAALPEGGRGIPCKVCGSKPWAKAICDQCGAVVCVWCARGWIDGRDRVRVLCNPCYAKGSRP